uniref:Uncharacterized protein n=1 Tax=Pseudomonas syringae TaxID=317 RepID=I3W2G8_PSESX|nr:hypothetical protein [Pseudomonas syringae]
MESKIATLITTMKNRAADITMYPAASMLTILSPYLSFAEHIFRVNQAAG